MIPTMNTDNFLAMRKELQKHARGIGCHIAKQTPGLQYLG